jgi:hypothetical protein
MTSEFQKEGRFPIEKLAKLQSVTVTYNDGKQLAEMAYQDLRLCVQGNQLCWHYESEGYDLFLPIARYSTIEKLYK